MHIHALPYELLSFILAFVDSESLCLTAPHVCKFWRQLYSNMPEYCVTIDLRWMPSILPPNSTLRWFGRLHPRADGIFLSPMQWFDLTDTKLNALTNCFPYMTQFVCGTSYSLLSDSGIANALRNVTVSRVSFLGCTVGDLSFKAICGPALKELEVPWVTGFTEKQLEGLVNMSPNLCKLNVRGCLQLSTTFVQCLEKRLTVIK